MIVTVGSDQAVAPDDGPVFLFDLDGTLTREELLPLLADEIGLGGMRELTDRTMQGEYGFDQSFRMRVDMLRDVPLDVVAEIVRSVPVNEQLMGWISERKERCWVVTGNLDCWVEPWLDKWGLRGFTSTSMLTTSGIGIAPGGVLDKATVLPQFSSNFTAMAGDGANDAGIVMGADFGIGVQIIHTIPDLLLSAADCVVNSEGALCRILSRL
ncbi:MAG TPA: HAD-IB family phosphatase [Lacisediminihabitans sp.]|uniref:HAD-IB family phosphatase n=1 Tax=Lacisediminihabitans sp. TaxID=2787631 RepID=UPI002ED9404F